MLTLTWRAGVPVLQQDMAGVAAALVRAPGVDADVVAEPCGVLLARVHVPRLLQRVGAGVLVVARGEGLLGELPVRHWEDGEEWREGEREGERREKG